MKLAKELVEGMEMELEKLYYNITTSEYTLTAQPGSRYLYVGQ